MGMHTNNGSCLGCAKIFNRYPGFNKPLLEWFFNVQEKHPEFHTNCAGRGKIDQEACFDRGASKAHWLESAHNFNLAIDTFFQINGVYNVSKELYEPIVKDLPNFIDWYGRPDALFRETPHFQIKDWRRLDLEPVE